MAHPDNSRGITIGFGDQLDHYRIDRVIAEGRAATTFRATDLLTDRTVAIVVPRPEIEADPVSSERFQREEEVEKDLEHPGLIRLVEKHARREGSRHSYLAARIIR
jgi:serine/threonine protein kinase